MVLRLYEHRCSILFSDKCWVLDIVTGYKSCNGKHTGVELCLVYSLYNCVHNKVTAYLIHCRFATVRYMEQGMAPDKAAFAALSKIYHFYPSFSGAIVALSKNGVHGRRSLMSAVIDCVAVILCACIRVTFRPRSSLLQLR